MKHGCPKINGQSCEGKTFLSPKPVKARTLKSNNHCVLWYSRRYILLILNPRSISESNYRKVFSSWYDQSMTKVRGPDSGPKHLPVFHKKETFNLKTSFHFFQCVLLLLLPIAEIKSVLKKKKLFSTLFHQNSHNKLISSNRFHKISFKKIEFLEKTNALVLLKWKRITLRKFNLCLFLIFFTPLLLLV